ncbi:MAG TPA: hypothetical protein VIV15_05025, partial [Anaerolineales bacterium]
LPYREGAGGGAPGAASEEASRRNPTDWSSLGRWLKPGSGMLLLAALIFALAAEPLRNRYLALWHAEVAPAAFFRGLRAAARPLTGPLPPSGTIHEYERLLAERLEAYAGSRPFAALLRPAREEVQALARLYTASLFSAQRPERAQVMDSARAWSRLRWRLWIVRLLGKPGVSRGPRPGRG